MCQPGGAHRDEAAIDVVPQRQARAAAQRLEFPSDIVAPVVLQHFGSVGPRHCCFGNLWLGRCHRSELYRRSNRTQASIGVKGRPLAQMRRISQRLPYFFRRVAQFADENERPLLFTICVPAPFVPVPLWRDPVRTARDRSSFFLLIDLTSVPAA